jgi:hypothetical protein
MASEQVADRQMDCPPPGRLVRGDSMKLAIPETVGSAPGHADESRGVGRAVEWWNGKTANLLRRRRPVGEHRPCGGRGDEADARGRRGAAGGRRAVSKRKDGKGGRKRS